MLDAAAARERAVNNKMSADPRVQALKLDLRNAELDVASARRAFKSRGGRHNHKNDFTRREEDAFSRVEDIQVQLRTIRNNYEDEVWLKELLK
jgi:hypothetical protein